MRQIVLVFIVFFSLSACDDGDVITVDLDFDMSLDRCENFEDFHLVYDTREDPNEALILIINKNTANDLLFRNPTPVNTPTILNIDESNIRFIYRTYNRALESNDLCQIVPPSDLVIQEDFEASTGTVEVTVTIEDDDGDGIPSELEGRGEPDENGNFPNAQNSDDDNIPDYLDEDDDNDNVPTRLEIDTDNLDGDDNPLTNPLDTDGDGTADYLDEDDDGDGVDTKFEDEDADGPINDLSLNADGESVPFFRNVLEDTTYDIGDFTLDNSYTRNVFTSFLVRDIDLTILRTDVVDMGILNTVLTLPDDEN